MVQLPNYKLKQNFIIMKHSLKVVLKISKSSVPLKIKRARSIVETVSTNVDTFPTPSPSLDIIFNAIEELEVAWNATADGGKTKTAIMHDKEDVLMKLLNDLAHYVESVANGDETIVHLAGMSVKSRPVFHVPDFEVVHSGISGEVKLRVKPQAKTLYHWEFCLTSPDENEWQFANETFTSNTIIGGLNQGATYYFRVKFLGHLKSSYPYQPISIIVI